MKNNSYVFGSGKYKYFPLESVFLNNPIHIATLYQVFFEKQKPGQVNNRLQLAIESLLEKIKALDSTKNCPYCKKAKVKFFLFPDYGPVNNKLLCCGDDACREHLKSARLGELHEINDFLLLISYLPKPQAQKIVSIFKMTHNNLAEAFA
ncbi:MAG: hypothetical protein WCT50_01500 [Patescibacteria group bacterium]